MSELRRVLLDSYNDGVFFETLFNEAVKGGDATNVVANELLHLHNEGKINVIAAYTSMQLAPSYRGSFTLIHVLSKILPDIESPVVSVMDCIEHLINKGHAIHLLVNPFFNFCGKSEARSAQVMENLKDDYQNNADFLAAALISGSTLDLQKYAKIAMNIAICKDLPDKEVAIRSLGRMPFQSGTSLLDDAFKLLVAIPSSTESHALLPITLKTLHQLYLLDQAKESALIQFINGNSQCPDAALIQSVSDILFFDNGKSSAQVENALFEVAIRTSHEDTTAINNLDYALEKLVARGESEKSILLLEKILLNDHEISIEHFDGLSRVLIENRETLLSKHVTKWLLSGEISKGRMCFDLLKNCGTSGLELSYDLSQLASNHSAHHLFLAEKACGWFFSMPLTAISLISSLIDGANPNQIAEIKYIVSHTLLISYPGTVGEYLKLQKKKGSNKVKRFCKALLEALGEYHRLLQLSSGIKELKPSQEDRLKAARYSQALNAEAMKKAEKESLMSALFPHKTVLLYGRKSIYFVHNGDQKIRQETPLATFSTSIEYPSLEIISPHNLEFYLVYMRRKGFTK